MTTSVISLFCEDIREEKNGSVTLIGIMPDNVEGQIDPALPQEGTPYIPKLCIYSRLNFDPTEDIGPIKSTLYFPNGEAREISLFDNPTVIRAAGEALERGAPVAGVYSTVALPNFPILSEGRLKIEVTIKQQTYVAGALNLIIARSSPSTASERPS